ncbi:MAG: response regulator transcription factor [Bacteroidota bacterium]|nr:response regulator transcription factor [Bacteroidota bacterium]
MKQEELLLKCEASSADEVLFHIDFFRSGVIIIDHNDPAFGISVIRKIKLMAPEVHFLSISDKPNRWMLSDALSAGITSYLLRDCGKDEIMDAIRATSNGEQFFCGKILNEVLKTNDELSADPEQVSCEGLKISDREGEIIRLVAEGFTNKEIADKLFLSAHTVTTHRKNIMAKLGVNNTAGLVLFAIRNNIVSPNHFLFNTN